MLLTVVARSFDQTLVHRSPSIEAFLSNLLKFSLHSWISPNYLVFVLTYVFLETRLVRRFCPAVA